MVLLLAVLITLVDALSMIHRAYQYALDIYSGEGRFSLATVWRTVILNQDHKDVSTSEFTGKPDPGRYSTRALRSHPFLRLRLISSTTVYRVRYTFKTPSRSGSCLAWGLLT